MFDGERVVFFRDGIVSVVVWVGVIKGKRVGD